MKKENRFSAFLKRKDIEISVQRYIIDAMKFMSFGLFSTLLMGSILNQIGFIFGITFLTDVMWPAAQQMTGPAIAVAVAYSLHAPPLVILSCTVGGFIGNSLGGPAGSFVAALIGAELGKAVAGETKVDLLVTPFVTMLASTLVAMVVGKPIGLLMTGLGEVIMWATVQRPVIMGIVISVIVGMVLTLPISSAALCIMLNLSGIAAGAATVGCCCQMVGFAVQSHKDNDIGGFVAQFLGTSMIQIPNIVKNWRIWIPPTLASALLGPLATTVFQMTNTPVSAGMGTCGFVGQVGTVISMSGEGKSTLQIAASIGILQILLPAVVTYLIYLIVYRMGWIADGDMSLENT
ncbi:MAG: PTS sugar transporter subunit IIC [Eubacteriaceae bacterium]|jgi:uncharacterized membrane protein|nr:PTS sugar transporter subunit IIC [Eubacteriaceae bacterium]